MSRWRQKTLGDFISLQRGYDLTADEREEGNVPVMGAAGQNGFHNKSLASGPGIIVGRSGGSFGQVHFVKENYWPHNTAMFVTDFKGNDRYFTYYLLKNLDFSKLNSGSAQPSLNRNYVYPTKIIVPEPSEQKQIAAVLSALDAKIDCNNRINAELGAMAKTLYDYWFVQFDFPFDFAQDKPDKNGKPYKSSGGRMVYNPTLKRDIPAGWKAVKLSELLQNRTDSITSSEVDNDTPYTPIDSLPMKKMSFGCAQPSSEAKTSLIKYKEKDILIGAMRVYFHRVCIAPFDGITRTTTLVLRPKAPDTLPYLYQVCNEDRTINVATKISVGTQQPYVNWEKALENHSIPYPNDDTLIKKYSLMMQYVTKDVVNRERESAELEKLRDWLLPMLMNGQVTVEPC